MFHALLQALLPRLCYLYILPTNITSMHFQSLIVRDDASLSQWIVSDKHFNYDHSNELHHQSRRKKYVNNNVVICSSKTVQIWGASISQTVLIIPGPYTRPQYPTKKTFLLVVVIYAINMFKVLFPFYILLQSPSLACARFYFFSFFFMIMLLSKISIFL